MSRGSGRCCEWEACDKFRSMLPIGNQGENFQCVNSASGSHFVIRAVSLTRNIGLDFPAGRWEAIIAEINLEERAFTFIKTMKTKWNGCG